MRRSGALLVAAAVAAAIPNAPAQAGLGGLLGLITAPLHLFGGHPHFRSHASRHAPSRHHFAREHAPQQEAVRAALPDDNGAGRTRGSSARAAPAQPSGSDTYGDMLGYALWPAQYADRFWAHGYADIGNALIEPAALKSTVGSSVAMQSRSAGGAWATICEPKSAEVAEHMTQKIEERVSLTASQRALLDKLRDAIARAVEAARPICESGPPDTPAARLQAIVDELWALRDAEVVLRGPLEQFYNSLDDEQKNKLIGLPPPRSRQRSGAQDNAARVCLQQAAAASFWPMQKIEEIVAPTPEQRAHMQALQEKSIGLARFLMTSCPQQPATTPVDRLDSAGDRLNAMLYAAMSIAPELDAFYASLSEEQKAKLNALGG